MIYDVDYFIKKFEVIPAFLFGTGSESFLSYNNHTCALGFCRKGEQHFDYSDLSEEGKALVDILTPLKEYGVHYLNSEIVWKINDGGHPDYKQGNPKDRILAALYDIKKMQDGDAVNLEEEKPKIKEVIRYVAVDAPIRKEVQEIVVNEINN